VKHLQKVGLITVVWEEAEVALLTKSSDVGVGIVPSGGATPGRARSNDLAGISTALAQALAPPCLALRIALLR